MAATVVGTALDFGLTDEELSLSTQTVSITNRSDKKEVRDKQGCVTTVAYYNKTSEVSIEGYGDASSNTPGASITLSASTSGDVVGTVYVDEVTLDRSNEDFVKSSVRATAYEGIS